MQKIFESDTYRYYSSITMGRTLYSFLWKRTSAITGITLTTTGSGFRNGSRFDLYMFM